MTSLFKKTPAVQEELSKARVCGKWEQVLSLEQRYKNKSVISSMHTVIVGYYYCIANCRWSAICSESRGDFGAVAAITKWSSTS